MLEQGINIWGGQNGGLFASLFGGLLPTHYWEFRDCSKLIPGINPTDVAGWVATKGSVDLEQNDILKQGEFIGDGIRLNGSGDNLANLAFVEGDFTYSILLQNLKDTSQPSYILGRSDSNDEAAYIRFKKLWFRVDGGSSIEVPGFDIAQLDVVIHIARIGNDYTFYQDAVNVGSVTEPGLMRPNSLGARLEGIYTTTFEGTIRAVEIFNKGLSPIEVVEDFNKLKEYSAFDVLYWEFRDCSKLIPGINPADVAGWLPSEGCYTLKQDDALKQMEFVGDGIKFDGSNKFLDGLIGQCSLCDYSVAIRFKTESLDGVLVGSPLNNSHLDLFTSTAFTVYPSAGFHNFTVPTYTDNQEHVVVLTFSNTNELKLYFDGGLSGTQTYAGLFSITRLAGRTGGEFSGAISVVKEYNKVLSLEEAIEETDEMNEYPVDPVDCGALQDDLEDILTDENGNPLFENLI